MQATAFQPNVDLVKVIDDPFNLAIATARTCYSSKGIISPADVVKDDKAIALRDRIAVLTRDAGHLTTRQHAHFVFAINGVSRWCIWSFLHSHLYYNSEQVSQRYVKVKGDNFAVPPFSEKGQHIYLNTVEQQIQTYQQMIETLVPVAEKEFFKVFPSRAHRPERWVSTIKKKAYEIARYALPNAMHAYLYHTISALTLMRYHRLHQMFDTPFEQRTLVEGMVQQALQHYPDMQKDLVDPIPLEETLEYQAMQSLGQLKPDISEPSDFIQEFDASLDGQTSKLVDYKAHAESTLAQSVRSVLGVTSKKLSDHDALDLVLNPTKNPYLADTLNVSTLSKLSRVLLHVHYTFRKKISLSADAQDQRHRTVPASRPILHTHYTGQADYITPKLVHQSAAVKEMYDKSMQAGFEAMNQLLDMGEPVESVMYLLPNSFPVRMEESGDLLNLHHKWKIRTCYNSQEEIFHASVEELQQVAKVHPTIAEHIKAPCYVRKHAGMTPYCPEKDRYCGVRVWDMDVKDYERII